MIDYEGKYIKIVNLGLSKSKKTQVWEVLMIGDLDHSIAYLGFISWYGSWRGYAFFPREKCVFEQKCLRDIADFVEQKTKEQRNKHKENKK